MPPAALVLASTSRYRAELLGRLGLPFTQAGPHIDENPRPREAGPTLARRLALAKARTVARLHPEAWVIGSDQVAVCKNQLLGKPGDRETAIAQLRFMSGSETAFVTALALIHAATGTELRASDTTVVRWRRLSRAEIERYVDAEPSFDCAGSAKIEGLGVTLTAEVRSTDPTALIGLPLIATARLLRKAGFVLP